MARQAHQGLSSGIARHGPRADDLSDDVSLRIVLCNADTYDQVVVHSDPCLKILANKQHHLPKS